MKKLVLLRRCSQIFFLGFFVYVLWSTTYPLKGAVHPTLLYQADPLIMGSTSLSERVFLGGSVFAVVMLALTAVLGRSFCGWVCPLGTVIDAAGALGGRRVLTDEQNRRIRRGKYFLLGGILIAAAAGIQAAWFFDPLVITARFISLNLIPAVTGGIDRIFIFFIRTFDLYGPVYDFYRELKFSFLGVRVSFFRHAFASLGIFLLLTAGAVWLSRAWCRILCPLGALLNLVARMSPLRRRNEGCVGCQRCQPSCRMGAIRPDHSYHPGECIMCMDCVYACPPGLTYFSFRPRSRSPATSEARDYPALSRKNFLFLLFSSLSLFGFRRGPHAAGRGAVIRPPGALNEEPFLNVCVRCGNCMKVCLTNGLQPVMLEAGPRGMWTPRLVPEIGYCEYQCTLCGGVCPTGAIRSLPRERKMKIRLGVAEVDRTLCIAWADNKQCIVCEEHCPVAEKAIKIETVVRDGQKVFLPRVDAELCIGCGICQNKCPVRPVRAIRVNPARADREGRLEQLPARTV